jgi:flagellar biosynthesis anti-sigma factor FlgM
MNDVTKTSSNWSQPDSTQNNSIKGQDEKKQSKRSQNPASVDKNASSVDSAHVAEVQSAISNGEYTVDANRIADKILAFEDFINK